jgi:hypothetical protein
LVKSGWNAQDCPLTLEHPLPTWSTIKSDASKRTTTN